MQGKTIVHIFVTRLPQIEPLAGQLEMNPSYIHVHFLYHITRCDSTNSCIASNKYQGSNQLTLVPKGPTGGSMSNLFFPWTNTRTHSDQMQPQPP